MSLINEALKKAQRLRTEDPADIATSVPGSGTRVEKRGAPRSAQQLVLIAAGGLVLVVLSVVVTFWFVDRTPAAKPAPKPAVVKSADTAAPSPTIVAPAIKPPIVATETPPAKSAPPPGVAAEKSATSATPAPGPTPAATLPSSSKVAETSAPPTVAPAAITPPTQLPTPSPTAPPPLESTAALAPATAAPAVASATPAPVTTDPRVHAFVDAIKVMGIRSSSSGDSRVLMNDRVFRVNDIVDRNLGVRLTKVEPDMLTFTDANGATYTKNF